MKLRLAALAALCAAATPAALASPAPTPSPGASTAAFGKLLHHRYGPSLHGYWTCPAGQSDGRNQRGCLGEVRAGRYWHQVSTDASLKNGRVVFAHVFVQTWKRHWWPYSRRFILRSQESQVPGVVSVNSNAYDWGWLAMGAHGLRAGNTRLVDAYDGDGAGRLRFFNFTCTRRGSVTTCRNALGDVMRYRPKG